MSSTGSSTTSGTKSNSSAQHQGSEYKNAKGRSIHHGQTPAAWVGSLTAMVAVILAGLALVLQNWPLFWISIGLLAAAAIAGKILQKMGYGAY